MSLSNSSLHGHLDCFHILATVNNVAMNIGVHVSILFFLFFSFFWLCHTACRILVTLPGIEPAPSAVKAHSLNHGTTREFPTVIIIIFK